MPSFMAKWSAAYPGCSGHIHQSLSDGKTNLFFDAKGRALMSKLFESYLAGQVACLMEFAPMFWPTINSYKRLVDGFWAPVKPTWGMDNRTASFRVIAGAQEHAAGDALPRRRRQPLPGDGRRHRRRPARRREGPEAHRAADHRHQPGRRAHPARAAHADRDDPQCSGSRTIARDWLGDTFVDHFAATREWECTASGRTR
jgi:glutamine synthetase